MSIFSIFYAINIACSTQHMLERIRITRMNPPFFSSNKFQHYMYCCKCAIEIDRTAAGRPFRDTSHHIVNTRRCDRGHKMLTHHQQPTNETKNQKKKIKISNEEWEDKKKKTNERANVRGSVNIFNRTKCEAKNPVLERTTILYIQINTAHMRWMNICMVY